MHHAILLVVPGLHLEARGHPPRLDRLHLDAKLADERSGLEQLVGELCFRGLGRIHADTMFYSRRLRNIHEVFSWTCMRCVRRSIVT